jgi:hypothetical protein
MCAIRSISVFFAVVFFLLFAGCVVDAASGGSPRPILPVMLGAEAACGLCIMVATVAKRRVR